MVSLLYSKYFQEYLRIMAAIESTPGMATQLKQNKGRRNVTLDTRSVAIPEGNI